MQPYHFRLERVLEWRRSELRREEAKLETLQAELRALAAAMEETPRRRAAAQNAVIAAGALAGSEVAALESWRVWAIREAQRLAALAAEKRSAIAAQTKRVAEARLRVKLLERLDERRYEEWKAESDREMETLSGEFAVAQWRRERASA